MPTHIAPENILADYAAGAASPGVSLLVATHLTQAPHSRENVRAYENVGGCLLRAEKQVEVGSDALDRTLAMIDGLDSSLMATVTHGESPLPAVLMDEIGVPFDRIPWKFQLPGVSVLELDGFEDEKVSLMRARPGARVPQHTHEGMEMTLVLQGCLSDGGIEYRKGDIALNDEHDDHQPQITGDETCYCLIVQQGDLRFTGRFSRFLNYLGE